MEPKGESEDNKRSKTESVTGDGDFDQFKQTLSEVKRLLMLGNLNVDLAKKIIDLNDYVKNLQPELRVNGNEELLYLSLCLICEYYDHLGLSDKSRSAVEDGEKIYKELLQADKPFESIADEHIFREKIRYVSDYAMVKNYRANEYDSAKKKISDCIELVNKYRTFLPLRGTLGQLHYYLGRINRQDHNNQAALENFSKAIQYFYERGEISKKECQENNEENQNEMTEELTFIRHRTANCLALGFAWISYTKGHLRQALHFVLPARVLYLPANDPISIAYTDLIYGVTLRSLQKISDKTIEIISSARDSFRKLGHKPYQARAAVELALAYQAKRDLQQAELALNEADDILKQFPDDRWLCNALIAHSRIERELKGDYDAARRYAREAYEIAHHKHLTLAKIDSLIAQGEASIRKGDMKDAREKLERARSANEKNNLNRKDGAENPKIEAVCVLHIAYSYVLEKEIKKAEENYQKWDMIKSEIEHIYIHELARKVRNEIELFNYPFEIPSDTTDLNFAKWEQKLRIYLVSQAKRRKLDKEQQRELLGVSRPTFLKWEKAAEEEEE